MAQNTGEDRIVRHCSVSRISYSPAGPQVTRRNPRTNHQATVAAPARGRNAGSALMSPTNSTYRTRHNLAPRQLFAREALWRCLHDRCRSRENLGMTARLALDVLTAA